jgi:hypothetical protein
MNARLALITFLDGGGGGNYPDQGLPTPPVYPGHGLPVPGGPVDPGYGQGHPLPPHPWWGGHLGGPRPDQGLPGGGWSGNYPTTGPVLPPVPNPPTIDNTLPSETPPPQISLPIYLPPEINPTPPDQARKFELKYSVRYGWVLVPVGQPPTAEPK